MSSTWPFSALTALHHLLIASPDAEQEKEDGFARTLLRIGLARCCGGAREGMRMLGRELKSQRAKRGCVGFLGGSLDGGGGVWALEFDVDEEEPPETARLRMAVTMEERCTVLQKLGAKFYEDPKKCPGLKGPYDDVLSCRVVLIWGASGLHIS